jgi:hypothetical protein
MNGEHKAVNTDCTTGELGNVEQSLSTNARMKSQNIELYGRSCGLWQI